MEKIMRGMLRSVLIGLVLLVPQVQAQSPTRVRFVLDWVVQGQSAHFFNTLGRGYFRQEGLDVTIDAGAGSGAAIQRVATSYDMGFADLGVLIETMGNNPGAPAVQGVFLVYEKNPNALLFPRKAGINSIADLKGKRLGAPTTSPIYRLWPLFARANGLGVDDVTWLHMAPNLVEPAVMQGNVDVGTGQPTQAVLYYKLGLKPEDLTIMKYADHGVAMYGHVVLVNTEFAKKNPQAVSAFLRAYVRGLKETLVDPVGAVKFVMQASPTLVEADEVAKLRLMLDSIDTPNARVDGLGAIRKETLDRMIADMTSTFKLKAAPAADALFTSAFLPSKADRMLPAR
jgi:NitT/TauT family transport system substrate-binding protein